jgi:hypothetical protein
MSLFKRTILPVLLVGIWINISETVKWLLILKSFWVEHYQNINLIFPDGPINGMVWMIWGFFLAITIFIFSKKFNLLQTTFLAWFVVFVMLWVLLWNIDMLPVSLLWYNVPLSLLEVFVGALICKRFSSK